MIENLAIDWPGSWPPNDTMELVPEYGRIYSFAMALEIATGVEGWRLPTNDDFAKFIAAIGGKERGAAALKVCGQSGYQARFAGFREPEDNTFRRLGQQTGFWTSTPADAGQAWKFWLKTEHDHIRLRPDDRSYGDSIRFVRS